MGFRRVSLRGLKKVTGEWTLVCMAWNLKRLAVLSNRQKSQPTPNARPGAAHEEIPNRNSHHRITRPGRRRGDPPIPPIRRRRVSPIRPPVQAARSGAQGGFVL